MRSSTSPTAMRFTTVVTPGTPRASTTACSASCSLFTQPAQPDRLPADPADVDRPLGEDRIVAERLEHPFFQPFIRHAFILQLVVVVVILAEVVGDHRTSYLCLVLFRP